jgi:hypothetical protein
MSIKHAGFLALALVLQGCGAFGGEKGKVFCEAATKADGKTKVELCCKDGKPAAGADGAAGPTPECCGEKDAAKLKTCLAAQAKAKAGAAPAADQPAAGTTGEAALEVQGIVINHGGKTVRRQRRADPEEKKTPADGSAPKDSGESATPKGKNGAPTDKGSNDKGSSSGSWSGFSKGNKKGSMVEVASDPEGELDETEVEIDDPEGEIDEFDGAEGDDDDDGAESDDDDDGAEGDDDDDAGESVDPEDEINEMNEIKDRSGAQGEDASTEDAPPSKGGASGEDGAGAKGVKKILGGLKKHLPKGWFSKKGSNDKGSNKKGSGSGNKKGSMVDVTLDTDEEVDGIRLHRGKTAGPGKGSSDKGSNDKGSNGKGSNDKGSNDKGSNDKGSGSGNKKGSSVQQK